MSTRERMERMEMWKKIIDEASSSGIGIRVWCHEKGISASQYYYWHKVLIDEGMLSNLKKESGSNNRPAASLMETAQPVFAEIDLGGTSGIQSSALPPFGHLLDSKVVVQCNSCQIFVGEGFSASTLSRVLEVVGNAS